MALTRSSMIVFFVCLATVTGSPVSFNTQPNPELMGGYYQGDMVLEPQRDQRGVAIRFPYGTRWPGGVVPYEFAANISDNHTTLIVQMMREMESLTAVNDTPCIQFREKNDSDTIFITIFNGTGCYAAVGSWGDYVGPRPLSLLHSSISTCMVTGIIQHELNHILGFYHEQSRPDRDDYVSIRWSNIQPGTESNFNKYNTSQVDTLMTSYDYGSVMHYGLYDFATNRSAPTIVALMNTTVFIGQRIGLSPIDILEIQRFYGCLPVPSDDNVTVSTDRSTSILLTTPTAALNTTYALTTNTSTETITTATLATATTNTSTTSWTTTSTTSQTTSRATTATTTSAITTTTTIQTTSKITASAVSFQTFSSQLLLHALVLISIISLFH